MSQLGKYLTEIADGFIVAVGMFLEELLMLALLLLGVVTVPVWILPYMIFRKMRKDNKHG